MNISSPKSLSGSVLHFGAVYKKDPKPQESAYFQQKSLGGARVPQSYYATGEDAVVVNEIHEKFEAIDTSYRRAKIDFMRNAGYSAHMAGCAVAAACNLTFQEESHGERRAYDDMLIQNFPNVKGLEKLVAARDAYEVGVVEYLAKTAELAQKAQ